MKSIRTRILYLIAIFVLLLFTGVLSVSAQDGGDLSVGVNTIVDTLDVNVTTFSAIGQIMGHVYDPLIWQEPLGTFHPGLATTWSVNEDASEYTFTLRDDVTFHDGTAFNAEDVKYTFDRIVDPDTLSQGAFSRMGTYEETVIIDDYTVMIRFSTPFAPFLDSVSQSMLGMTSAEAVEAMGDDYGITGVVSTGPYMVESHIPDSEVVLVRNPDYAWGSEAVFGQTGPGNFERIIYKFIPEDATRVAAFESGEIDFDPRVAGVHVERLQANDEVTIVQIEQPGHGWSMMFNFENTLSDELAVRQAIAQAINKQALIDIVFDGLGTPGCSPLTKVMFAYTAASCDAWPYDPEAARATLEAAGWVDSDGDGVRDRDGVPLILEHWGRDVTIFRNMTPVFLSDLAAIGIQLNINLADSAGYFDAVRAGEHQTQNWWDTQTDPDGVMRTLYHSSNADGGTNRNRYRNDEMDALIDAGAAETDSEARAEIYAQIQQKIADEVIMVFLNDPFLVYGANSSLSGVRYLGGGNLPNFYAASMGD